MKRDIIERLAMDSAAGELNKDMEALFREYLAEHFEAKKWAENLSDVFEKTEAAIAAKIEPADAESNHVAIKIKPISQFKWWLLARWAAVIIFAACIGAAVGRWSKSPVLTQKPDAVLVSRDPSIKRGFSLDDIGKSFWRAKATAMLDAKSYREITSYNQSSNLWNKYRQYIKEKRYE
jgi:hypothetical protein